MAENKDDLLVQIGAVLIVGSLVVLPIWSEGLISNLPKPVRNRIKIVKDWLNAEAKFDAILHHGDSDQLAEVSRQASRREGAIIGVNGLSSGETDIPLERLLVEHALSVNTAAAGGNANLMTLG
ncbi:hypothetical protein TRP66_18460 [Pseudomonas sp. JDS28PS106]|uniref:hypothetical protein n=1 Tax=Pseudomonas sp. JDS28PS106 TaxID=2497235 RepID=UPI002FD2ECA1